MKEMTFYEVDKKYIDTLLKVDSRVMQHKGKLRPYLAIKISFNGKEYLIPFSSYKQGKRVNRFMDVIFDPKNSNYALSYLMYGNMIPFHSKIAKEINFNTMQDKKLADLLMKEYTYCSRVLGKEHIAQKANNMYNARTNAASPSHEYSKKFACDFYRLEMYLKEIIRLAGKSYSKEFQKGDDLSR